MKLNPKQQLLAWCISGTIFLLAGVWVNFSLLHSTLQTKATKIVESRITLELNSRQQQNLSALKNQVNQILQDTESLNAAFFDRTKTLDFLKYIENLAATKGLTLEEPQLSAPARTSTDTAASYSVEEKPFRFEVRGNIKNLMSFLHTIEINPAYILIQTVDLRKSEQETESTLSLEGIIPWH